MKPGLLGGMIGLVVGVVIGATVIAPGLPQPESASSSGLVGSLTRPGDIAWKATSVQAGVLPGLGLLPKRIELDLRRVSGGGMDLKVHEPGAVVPAHDVLDAVAIGGVDAVFGSPAIWASKAPALALFSGIPFGVGAAEFLTWMEHGGGRDIYETQMHRLGVHGVLCGIDPPGLGGWFRRPIEDPTAFKDLRVHIAGLGARVLERLGAVPIALDGPDILPAMEAAKLDGVSFAAPPTDVRLGFHRLARFGYLPGWNLPGTVFDLAVNLHRWQSLSDFHRARIEAVCADSLRRGLAETGLAAVSSFKVLAAEGAKLAPWPEAVEEALRETWAEVVNEAGARNPEFRQTWDALTQFRERYQTARTMGYVE